MAYSSNKQISQEQPLLLPATTTYVLKRARRGEEVSSTMWQTSCGIEDAKIPLSPTMFSDHLMSGYITTVERASMQSSIEGIVRSLVEDAMEPSLRAAGQPPEEPTPPPISAITSAAMEAPAPTSSPQLAVSLGQGKLDKALRDACWKGEAQLVHQHLAAGACVNSVDKKNGIAALNLAAFKGFPAIAQSLLAAKAEVDATDGRGSTALSLACTNGHTRLVRLLVDARGNPLRRDAKGKTCLDLALAGGHLEVSQYLTQRMDGA